MLQVFSKLIPHYLITVLGMGMKKLYGRELDIPSYYKKISMLSYIIIMICMMLIVIAYVRVLLGKMGNQQIIITSIMRGL